MDPLVSIVLPAYNAEKTIVPAIRSILGQTYQNFEVIIVDDFSQDRTIEAIQSFLDPRIILLRNKINLKAGPSRNIAIEKARGEFIALHDADDLSLPTRFEKQLNFLISHPEVDVVGSNAYVINNSGKILGVYGKGERTHEELTSNVLRGIGLLFPTIMTRAKWFKKNLLKNYPRAHDVELFLRSYRYSIFHNLADILYAWREPGKESNKKIMMKKMVQNSLSQIDMRYRNWKEYGLPFLSLFIYPFFVFRKWCYWMYCALVGKSPFARQYQKLEKDGQFIHDQEYIFKCMG